MTTRLNTSRWVLPLILLVWSASTAAGSSLTLGTPPGNDALKADDWLISGATVTGGAIQPAAYEAFSWWDKNNDGVWGGGDAQRRSIGTYENGLFGLYSTCDSWGAFSARHQYVPTQGILLIDDLMVTTDDPSPPTTIPTSVSFHVSGAISQYIWPTSPDLVGAKLTMRVVLNGAVFNGVYSSLDGGSGATTTVTGLGTQVAGGAFSGVFDATITTGQVNVPVNTPFELRLEVTVTASAGGGAGSAVGFMTFDALNTAGFLPGTPIFNDLPGGYRVDSQDAGIDNNVFPSAPVATEPATWGGIKRLFGHDRP